MTTRPAAAPSWLATVKLPSPGRLGSYSVAALYLLALLFMVRNLDLGFNLGDEGVALMGAWRILLGQIPHRDFFEIIPPFSFLPTALFFKLFGATLLSERLLTLVYGMGLVFVTERLTARFTPSPWARGPAVAILIPFGVFYWPMPSHHWIADLLQLAALLALLRALESPRAAAWSALAGSLCALACFTLQDQGAFLVIGLMALFFPWIQDRSLRRKLFMSWALGGAAVAAAFAAYLLPHVSLADLWYQWVTFPATRYKSIPGNSPGLFGGWSSTLSVWGRASSPAGVVYAASLTLLVGLIFSLPALAGLSLALSRWRRWLGAERLGLLAACALAFLGTCMHRWSLTNLIWAAPAFLIPACLALGRAETSASPALRAGARVLGGAVVAASLFFSAFYSSFAAPGHRSRVSSRVGELGSVMHEQAVALQQVVSAVELHVPEDGLLFVDGYMPLVSFLTQRPNPTRFNFFYSPLYHTEEHLAEVKGILESRPCFILAALPRDPANPFDAYLQSRYEVVWSNSRVLLYAPSQKPEPSPVAPPAGSQDPLEPSPGRAEAR